MATYCSYIVAVDYGSKGWAQLRELVMSPAGQANVTWCLCRPSHGEVSGLSSIAPESDHLEAVIKVCQDCNRAEMTRAHHALRSETARPIGRVPWVSLI